MTGTRRWSHLAPVHVASPVLAVAADRDQEDVWVGGVGGVGKSLDALRTPLTLAPVTTILVREHVVVAGGAAGIARSTDHGQTWQQSELQGRVGGVTTLAALPGFPTDGMAFAGTLGAGVLRSADGGHTWHRSSYRLGSAEISAMVIDGTGRLVAGTPAGTFASTDAGRSWHQIDDAAASALLALADDSLLIADDLGHLHHLAARGGARTSVRSPVSSPVLALGVTAAGSLLLGSAADGMWRRDTEGVWHRASSRAVLCFAEGRQLWAGTDTGLIVSDDDGASWQACSTPPLDDLSQLTSWHGDPVVHGPFSGALVHTADGAWRQLESIPAPLTAVHPGPDGTLLTAGGDAITAHTSEGTITHSASLHISHLTMRDNGIGWAAGEPADQLLRTLDGGQSWHVQHTPMGAHTILAVRAGRGHQVLAATLLQRHGAHTLWMSTDDGQSWLPAAHTLDDARKVAMLGDPPALVFGAYIYMPDRSGEWRQRGRLPGDVLRLSAGRHGIVALTTSGLTHSPDHGCTWATLPDVPDVRMLDVTSRNGKLELFDIAGRVWQYPLNFG